MKYIKSLLITTLITTSALGYTIPDHEQSQDVVADAWILPGKTTTGVTQDFYVTAQPDPNIIMPFISSTKTSEEGLKQLCSIMENSQFDIETRFFAAKRVFSYIQVLPELKGNEARKKSALDFFSSVASLEIPSDCFEISHSLPKRAKQLLEKFTPPESGSNSNTSYVKRKNNDQETKAPKRQVQKREEETLERKALRALEDPTTSDYDCLKSATLILKSSQFPLDRNLAINALLKIVKDNTASNDKIYDARQLIKFHGSSFDIKQLNEIIKTQNKKQKIHYNYQ